MTREGTQQVKRSRFTTLSQEFEIFIMKPEEKIIDLQNIFTHLTNHLIDLGKVLSNTNLNEEQEKKPKNTSLNLKEDSRDTSGEESYEDGMEDMNLLVKKFSKFLKRNKGVKVPRQEIHNKQ
ncbi:hypothetical protein Lal_00008157 [Lupinus albus]|nr:hypothetical protein Lal_00008157 [Lupinus albus]